MIDTLKNNPELLAAIIFALLGLIIILIAFIYFKESIDSKNWLPTKGVVLTSDVIKSRSTNSKDGTSIMYKPEICYAYTVRNTEYVSNRIMILFNYSSSGSSRAYRLTRLYSKNSQVTVYYNPEKPEISVLEPGLKAELILFAFFGAGFIIMTAFFIDKFDIIKLITNS